MNAPHDLTHKIHQGGKHQFAGVLDLGDPFKERIDPLWIEQVLQNSANQLADGALFNKRLKCLGESQRHRCMISSGIRRPGAGP